MAEKLATEETCKPEGLNFWHLGPENGELPEVDIIAVQGLDTNPYYTWIWKDDNNKKDKSRHVLWLRDLLPKRVPKARIASFSYSSKVFSKTGKTNLFEFANQFLRKLQGCRDGQARWRPLILIGHSLGGLVICKAITAALQQGVQGRMFAPITNSIAGIIFLGTPFAGSDMAKLADYCPKPAADQLGLDKDVLEFLSRNSKTLFEVAQQFFSAFQEGDISCFYEHSVTEYARLLKTQVVDMQSAIPLGKRMMYLDANHSQLNKYSSLDDENFKDVASEINRMLEQWPTTAAATQVGAELNQSTSLSTSEHRKSSPRTNASPRFWVVPNVSSLDFTGRSDVLEDMRESLLERSCPRQRVYVLTGMGGMGKSEVCLRLIEDVKDRYRVVAWIDVSSKQTAEKGLTELANIQNPTAKARDIDAAKIVLSTIEDDCLIVLDNADDPNIEYRDLAPTPPNWTVIMTSRNSLVARHKTVGHKVLEPLKPEECVDLVLKRAGIAEKDWPANRSAATEVAECLNWHTLALIIAGAYVESGKCTLSQYSKKFQLERKALLKWKPGQGVPRYGSVAATFEVSANALEMSDDQASVDALRLLELLSILNYTPFSIKVFRTAWQEARCLHKEKVKTTNRPPSEKEALIKGVFQAVRDQSFNAITYYLEGQQIYSALMDQLPKFLPALDEEWDWERIDNALELLSRLALIQYSGMADDTSTVSLHPLTHSWAWDRLKSNQKRDAWIKAGSVIALSNRTEKTATDPEIQLRPHIRSFAKKSTFDISDIDPGMAEEIYAFCADVLLVIREDKELESFLDLAFTRLQETGKTLSEISLPLRKARANNLMWLTKNQEGVKQWTEIVNIEKRTLPHNHEDRLTSERELAVGLFIIGERQNALDQFIRIRDICKRNFDEDHPVRLETHHQLAKAHSSMGSSELAIPIFEHVIEMRQKNYPERQPQLLISRHELGRAYRYNGRIKDSVKTLEDVVRIRKEILPETHPELLASQTELGSAYRDDDQTEESVQLLEHVTKIRTETLEEKHMELLYTETDLAETYWAANKYDEAIKYARHVVDMHSAIPLAPDHARRRGAKNMLRRFLNNKPGGSDDLEFRGISRAETERPAGPVHSWSYQQTIGMAWGALEDKAYQYLYGSQAGGVGSPPQKSLSDTLVKP